MISQVQVTIVSLVNDALTWKSSSVDVVRIVYHNNLPFPVCDTSLQVRLLITLQTPGRWCLKKTAKQPINRRTEAQIILALNITQIVRC